MTKWLSWRRTSRTMSICLMIRQSRSASGKTASTRRTCSGLRRNMRRRESWSESSGITCPRTLRRATRKSTLRWMSGRRCPTRNRRNGKQNSLRPRRTSLVRRMPGPSRTSTNCCWTIRSISCKHSGWTAARRRTKRHRSRRLRR
uniref:(northern house mosquito) hypothetical protein n=1 Tax=Culex pipiens TaxID=7175 RepID=A0A8D8BJZ5_CULPI